MCREKSFHAVLDTMDGCERSRSSMIVSGYPCREDLCIQRIRIGADFEYSTLEMRKGHLPQSLVTGEEK